MQSTEENTGDDELHVPKSALVFQCIQCHVIVGDSKSLHSSNEKNDTITLLSASNIKRTPDLFTSKGGYDIGSTYVTFNCRACSHPLGKFYLTTSKDLDDLRELFTFEIKNLKSYELGKGEFGKLPEMTNDTESTNQSQCEGADNASSLQAVIDSVVDDIVKIQHVLIGLDHRISAIENSQHSSSVVRDSLTDDRPAKLPKRH